MNYFIRLRSYPEGTVVTLWLCCRKGSADSALLWGELIPTAAEDLIAALGLPVEREQQGLTGIVPLEPPECLPVAKQALLFDTQELPQ